MTDHATYVEHRHRSRPAPLPSPRREPPRVLADPRMPPVAFAVLAAIAGAVLLYVGRSTTFYYDDWSFLLGRRGGGVDALLEPHNGHLSALPVAAYKALWRLVGLDDYWVFRTALTLLHLLAATLMYALVRPRLGAWPAVVAGGLLAFLGVAWQDVLWPFQIGFIGSVAGGLGAWLALDRKRDVIAAACLAAALACSGLGVPIVAAAIVELAVRREWRRLATVAGAPVALYGLWWLTGHGDSQINRDNFSQVPQWAVDMAAAAVGAPFGRGTDWGRPLLLVALGLLVWRASGPRALSPRLVGLGAAGAAFWVLTAASRANIEQPETSRYTYLGAVIVLLALAELLRGMRPRGRVLVLAVLIAGLGVAQNLTALSAGGRFLRATSDSVRAEFAAVELQRERVPPEYELDARLMPQVRAGQYLRLIDDAGSTPAYSPQELAEAGAPARVEADRVLREIGAAALAAPPAARDPLAPAPTVEASAGGDARQRRACVTLRPAAPEASMDLVVPPGGMTVRAARAPAAVAAWRFADQSTAHGVGTVPPGATQLLAPAGDASPVPWRARVTSAAPVRACGAAP